MLQYKIPQNVGIEDKIVGPFSLRQLIIIAVGAGVSYVLFAITSRIYELNIIEYVLMAMPALLALAIAMLKIHHVTFGKYIILMLEFAIKPKKRMWDHRGISALVAPDLTDKRASAKEAQAKPAEEKANVNLRDLTATLDSGGFEHLEKVKHEDIDEVNDDDLITEAYFGHKQKDKTDNMYWRTRDMQKKKLNLLAKMEKSPKQAAASAPVKEEPKKESVVEHLAGVIKEARKNNQTQKKEEIPTVTQATPPAEAPKKKRRKRKRKPKASQAPVRTNTQVDTTKKSEPNKIVKKTKPKEGETSFDDLSGGGEIEFNLD